MNTIPSARDYLINTGNFWKDGEDMYADYIHTSDLNKFATQVLEYNLKRYRE